MAVGLLLAACDPFAGLVHEQDVAVADGEANAVDLLTPRRRLPATARNVRIHEQRYQGALVRVRFDAPFNDARAFAERLAGGPLTAGGDPWATGGFGATPFPAWWPSRFPDGAYGGGGTSAVAPDGGPAVMIMMVRRGNMATVWLETVTI